MNVRATPLLLALVVMTLAVVTAARMALSEESSGEDAPVPIFSGRGAEPTTDKEGAPGTGRIPSDPADPGKLRGEDGAVKMEVYPAFEAEPRSKGGRSKVEVPHLQDFDPVPELQREPVIRRLKMIERLIREHGRAYDYRELTTTELNAILQALDHKNSLRTSGYKSK